MRSLADLALNRWAELLPALGVDARFLVNRHGACPICGGKDRFRWDNQHGKGGYVCSGCGAGDGFALAMKVTGRTFRDVAVQIETLLGQKPDRPTNQPTDNEDQRNRDAMRRVWQESRRMDGADPASRYMMARVGCQGIGLRFHPAMWTEGRKHPAMLAKVVTHDDKAANIHVTYLTEDGAKAAVQLAKKVMPGKLPDGCAIRLADAAPVMGVAEGIETAYSAAVLFGMPVWACVNGGLLAKWMPPAIAEHVTIFGDNDANYCGQSKAYMLANRLEVQFKRKATVMLPPVMGEDWNDVLKADGLRPRLRVV